MILKSYAKLNLFLEVIGKNDKNYHLLESLICFIDIFDLIKIEKSNNFSLKFSGEFGSILENDPVENIIEKTTKLMAKEFGFPPNLKIELQKNIPIGAGIGGGSSNAATIILAINEIFNLNLNLRKMEEIGLKIGCDVPICLQNNMSFVEGIGEKISQTPIKTQPLWALIINPRKILSTREVFSNLTLKNPKSQKIVENSNIIDVIKSRSNDLENPAIKLFPQIKNIIDEVEKQKNCLISRMSGSGSTCFGLFQNPEDLEASYLNLSKIFPDFYIKKSILIYKKQ